MLRRLIRGRLVALAAALLFLSACTASPPDTSSALTVIPVGERKAAPQLAGELLDGGTYQGHPGDVVVVNFWGSWCGPCVAEADDLENTYASTKDSGVSFVGVNVRDERDAAKRFAALRATYPSIFDPSSRVAVGFAVPPSATPTTIVIDRQGRIAATAYGPVQQATLEPVVTALAAEAA